MIGYEQPQVAIMKNEFGYFAEFLTNIPQTNRTDDIRRKSSNLIATIPVSDNISFREIKDIMQATSQGLDYLAQEVSVW